MVRCENARRGVRTQRDAIAGIRKLRSRRDECTRDLLPRNVKREDAKSPAN